MSRNAAETETRILDLAETMIRESGYNGFSFREIAAAVGVKSSSVHYYFPAKSDLGAKVARRYADRFLAGLETAEGASGSAQQVVDRIHAAFAEALGKDGKMCLCGVLAAESAGLPEDVVTEARGFFDRTSKWLADNLQRTEWASGKSRKEIETESIAVLAQLEGAMLIAKVQNRPEVMEQVRPSLA